MTKKHFFLILLIMVLFGSAYPITKLALNSSLPPILMASLRMGIVFICLIPFWKFAIPDKKYLLPLFGFAFSMGVCVFLFMGLSLQHASIVSPIIIGAQLAIPFGVIASSIFLKESVHPKKWFYISTAFLGVILIGFDPKLVDEIFALFLAGIMAFFYGISQVFSRHLKTLSVKLTNAYMGMVGFITLFILSVLLEGDTLTHLRAINYQTWILILHSAILVSLVAHLSMFYLYRFYPIDQVLPYYSLFPVFGLIQTFILFQEIPSMSIIVGGVIVISSVYLLQKIKA